MKKFETSPRDVKQAAKMSMNLHTKLLCPRPVCTNLDPLNPFGTVWTLLSGLVWASNLEAQKTPAFAFWTIFRFECFTQLWGGAVIFKVDIDRVENEI